MERLAERVPPVSNGVVALFFSFMNVKSWKHGVPGFVGFNIFDPEGCGKAACVRALGEHAGYTCRGHFEILREITGYDPQEATFCKGSSKGSLWPRIVADVLGIKLRIPRVREATSLGAFICAARALGRYGSIPEAAADVIRWEKEESAVAENTAAYDTLCARWRKLDGHALAIADEGTLPHMWRAAGA
jgi:autoinducer 2 (AI-2) kinase